MSFRFRHLVVVAYLMALHGALAWTIVYTDALPVLWRGLGFWPPADEWSSIRAETVVAHARRDPDVPDGAVILLGDSIMAGIDAAAVGADAVNFGLGGDSTVTLAHRLPMLRSVGRSRAVVLEVGVNDLKGRTVAQIARAYGAILVMLADRPRVVAVSVLPVDETADLVRGRPDLRNAAIVTLNSAIRAACAQRPNCRYLDAWPAVFDPATLGLRQAMHRGDGWHLSAAGGQAMGRVIGAAVAEP